MGNFKSIENFQDMEGMEFNTVEIPVEIQEMEHF